MSPRYLALRSDWNKIAERLKKLNDTRVRFAHHAIESGKGVMDFVAAGLDEKVLWQP
jgi:hypothetical protein